MLVIIDEERDGKVVDRDLLRQVVELFESMGMGSLDSYTADLEEPLLVTTREYYARKREEWIAKDSTPDYLIKAEKALEDEKERVLNYLNSHSECKVLRVCEEELLEKCQKTLLDKEGSGCKALLANDKTEDLERMFALFNRLDNGLSPMAKIVEEYIAFVGHSFIDEREARLKAEEKKEKPDDPDFIKKLLGEQRREKFHERSFLCRYHK
jgi:cullin 1